MYVCMFDQVLVKSGIDSELTYKQLTNITRSVVGNFQSLTYSCCTIVFCWCHTMDDLCLSKKSSMYVSTI